MESLNSWLKSKNYDAAIEFAKQYRDYLQTGVLKAVFNDYPPSPEPCPECGVDVRLSFHVHWMLYKPVPCENCQRLEVKEKLSKNLEERLIEHGIVKRFLNAKLSDFNNSIRKKVAGEEGLFITGPRGTGKTHLISAIAGNIIKNLPLHVTKDHDGRTYYFEPESKSYPLLVNIPKMLMKIKGTFNSDYGIDSEESILNKICSVPVLLLDDIGAEKASEWVKQTLYLIIDHRYGDMAKTYVTSNLTLNQIANQLDDRISSRIAGMTNTIRMAGKDRRL